MSKSEFMVPNYDELTGLTSLNQTFQSQSEFTDFDDFRSCNSDYETF